MRSSQNNRISKFINKDENSITNSEKKVNTKITVEGKADNAEKSHDSEESEVEKNDPNEKWPFEKKISILKEALEVQNIKKTAEKYRISDNMLRQWRKMYKNLSELRELNLKFEDCKFIPKKFKKE